MEWCATNTIIENMKHVLIFLFIQLTIQAFSQNNDKSVNQPDIPSDSITFVTKLNIANATKDGIYLNGYVVNMNYDKAKKLNGKTLKVSGKVTIIKGLRNKPKEYDEKGFEIIRQGRENDTQYIESPKVEIISRKDH
jgi:hypothetical protein